MLRRPGSAELEQIREGLQAAMPMVEVAIKGDINRAMSTLNRRPEQTPSESESRPEAPSQDEEDN